MDPYSKYRQQLEYYEYFEKQKENYVDLTKQNPNNSVKELATILFKKSNNGLDKDLTGILLDDQMETADIFCMVLELVLYGLDIITNGEADIFQLQESTDDMVFMIKRYLKSAGFNMEIHEELFVDDIDLYRDRTDYYCQIVRRPPELLCVNGWYVLNYRMIENKKHIINKIDPLPNYRAFFIASNKKIFVINFYFTL